MSFRVGDPTILTGAVATNAGAAARAENRAAQAVSPVRKADSAKELKKVCADMESIFLSMLFKEMQKTVPESTLYPREFGEDVYRDMLYDAYAESLSNRGGVGLAELLYEQLSRGLSERKPDE